MKSIGAVCYFLIASTVVLLLLTLIASQGINLLHLSELNRVDFEVQIALSFLHCLVSLGCAVTMLNGYIAGRRVWSAWIVLYLMFNVWQSTAPTNMMPALLALLLLNFVLYGKPAQAFFDEQARKRGERTSRRVDQSFNIFDHSE